METGYFPLEWNKWNGQRGNVSTGNVLNPPRLTLVSETGSEPVALADLKSWLRIDQTYEDSLITQLGKSARRQVEKYTNRSLVSQTFDLWMDHNPYEMQFEIPHLPVTSISYIQTYDLSNTVVTQDTSTYVLDANDTRAKVYLNIGNIWNVPTRLYNAFNCRFVSDGTAYLQPDVFIEAIKMLVDDKYQNRGQLGDPKNIEMSDAVKTMLQPFKLVRL